MYQNKVKELRELSKLSQEKLARIVEVSRETIRNIEKGKQVPNVILAIKIAEVLGGEIEKMFEQEKEE